MLTLKMTQEATFYSFLPFSLVQPSHCLPAYFSPVEPYMQLVFYSQGTRQAKVTACFQDTLQELVFRSCFHYSALPH